VVLNRFDEDDVFVFVSAGLVVRVAVLSRGIGGEGEDGWMNCVGMGGGEALEVYGCAVLPLGTGEFSCEEEEGDENDEVDGGRIMALDFRLKSRRGTLGELFSCDDLDQGVLDSTGGWTLVVDLCLKRCILS